MAARKLAKTDHFKARTISLLGPIEQQTILRSIQLYVVLYLKVKCVMGFHLKDIVVSS